MAISIWGIERYLSIELRKKKKKKERKGKTEGKETVGKINEREREKEMTKD